MVSRAWSPPADNPRRRLGQATRANLATLIAETVQEAGTELPEAQRRQLAEGAQRLAVAQSVDPGYEQALAIARLVEEIARSGERELGVCQAMLHEFAAYLRSR